MCVDVWVGRVGVGESGGRGACREVVKSVLGCEYHVGDGDKNRETEEVGARNAKRIWRDMEGNISGGKNEKV